MIQEKIAELVKPRIEAMGYIFWGCEYLAQGKQSLLRIYIDRKEGVGIEDCEIVSRQISTILDVEDPIPGYYRLEISSPGTPRPIFYDWQYAQYLGEEIKLKLHTPINGQRAFSGKIKSSDGCTLILIIETSEEQNIQISNIAKAKLTG